MENWSQYLLVAFAFIYLGGMIFFAGMVTVIAAEEEDAGHQINWTRTIIAVIAWPYVLWIQESKPWITK